MTKLASGEIKGKASRENAWQWFASQKEALLGNMQEACKNPDELRISFQEKVEFCPEECQQDEVLLWLQFDAYCESN